MIIKRFLQSHVVGVLYRKENPVFRVLIFNISQFCTFKIIKQSFTHLQLDFYDTKVNVFLLIAMDILKWSTRETPRFYWQSKKRKKRILKKKSDCLMWNNPKRNPRRILQGAVNRNRFHFSISLRYSTGFFPVDNLNSTRIK